MRVSWLRCTAVAPALVWTVNANVEKTIFLGPRAAAISAVPNAPESLDALRLASLSPAPASSILATQLPVRFPSASAPRGLESWYLLRGLDDGRRYEVRICWPATVSLRRLCPLFMLTVPQQPTDFWLDTFSIAHVFDTPDLISALARHSEGPQEPQIADPGPIKVLLPLASESALFLRIQAAASYYSTNRTLMEHPVPVHVDISMSNQTHHACLH